MRQAVLASRFTDEDIWAQRGDVTCPKSHSESAASVPRGELHHLLFILSQLPLSDQVILSI